MKVRRKVLAHVAWSAMCVSVCMGLVSMALVSPAVAQRSSQETKPTLTPQPSGADDRTPVPPDELPDSPGSIVAQAQAPGSPQPLQQPMQSESSSSQSTPQKPVGTAAAEAPSSAGVAASQPAGVAIAPAKQRRARTIIIRTGAIIGAAVAVGVVVGLTEATASKPPGAH
jgi:hypothetical protein